MNDYESSYIWDYEISCHDCLDEMYVSYNIQDTYDLDDDYARDSTDYQELAYRHYAWYNTHEIYTEGIMIARKHLIRVTLDIECYDDLYLEDLDWQDLLELEGDESVDVNIQQLQDAYWLWHFRDCLILNILLCQF